MSSEDDETAQYARWEANLAAIERKERFAITTDPDPGFYKRRLHRGGPWIPVWIYPKPKDDKPWQARRTLPDGRVEIVDAIDEWGKVLGRAITMEEYEHVAERGGEWFGTDPVVGNQVRENSRDSNLPADPAEVLADQIKHAIVGSQKYGKLRTWTTRGRTRVPIVDSLIETDEQFEQAQSMRSRLLELYREGDVAFHAEKDPITKEGKRVDERWRFRSEAEEFALIVREAMAAYQTRKLEAVRLAEEKHAQEIAEAKRAAVEDSDDISFVSPPPVAEIPAAPDTAVAKTVKGAYGRAATLGEAWDVVAITDQDALYRYMREHADLKRCLMELAQRALNKFPDRDIPGIQKKIRATVS